MEAKATEHFAAASHLYVLGQYAKAVDELTLSLRLNPGQPRAIRLLGISYQLIGNTEEAGQSFLKATRLDPADAEAWFYLGRLHYFGNFFDQALPELDRALSLSPGDLRIRQQLALTLEATGDTDRAVAEYEEGLRRAAMQNKPSWTLHLTYGVLLYKLNRLDDSVKELRAARDLKPDYWQPRFELGKLYCETGKPELAAAELTAALKTASAADEDAARIYRLLGRVYYALGRDDDAVAAFALAAKSKP